MSNPSKDKGTRRETAAKRYLQGAGWPQADRAPLRGNRDQGDLVVSRIPLIIAEVKYRDHAFSDAQLGRWLEETEREAVHAGADLGVLIVARKGVRVENWDAVMAANDWMLMLSGDQVLPTDAPWPMRTSLEHWSRIALAWVEAQ
jgi:hypothetical protein